VKESENTYDFDVKKANRIFDLLQEKKKLRLPANHVIPSVEELKGKKYCKFHNVTNHSTNEYIIFRFHVQKAIEQGRIKFELAKKPIMDIDKHPFLGVHMVEFQLAKEKTKVLTSAKAKEDGSIDPKVQISTEEYEEAKKQRDQQKSRYEQGGTSRAGALRPRITSRIC
jgi:hypothetical protein